MKSLLDLPPWRAVDGGFDRVVGAISIRLTKSCDNRLPGTKWWLSIEAENPDEQCPDVVLSREFRADTDQGAKVQATRIVEVAFLRVPETRQALDVFDACMCRIVRPGPDGRRSLP